MSESHIGKYAGENSHSWKGGRTPIARSIRASINYCEWRSKILKRDKFACNTCRQIGGKLEAHHHKKKLSEMIIEYDIRTLNDALKCEELWNINNGITLCQECHYNIHFKRNSTNPHAERLNKKTPKGDAIV